MGNSGSSRKNKQREGEGKPEPADSQKVQATEIEQTAKDDVVVVVVVVVVVANSCLRKLKFTSHQPYLEPV